MQFRKLKRLASKVGVEVDQPIYSFGEWEVPYCAKDGFDFNGQFTCSSCFYDDLDGTLKKSDILDWAWEAIEKEAEDITPATYSDE